MGRVTTKNTLRQSANRCRYPNSQSPSTQVFAGSLHQAAADLPLLVIGFCNYYGSLETASASYLYVTCAVEYPVDSGNLTFFHWQGGLLTGVCPRGGDILSDSEIMPVPIPKGAWFRLWHHHQCASGVLFSFGGVGGQWPDGNAYEPFDGNTASATSGLNYLVNGDDAKRHSISMANQDTSHVITPMCILTEGSHHSYGLLGDSRVGNLGGDAVSDASLLVGPGERVLGVGVPFINLGAGGDRARAFLDQGVGAKRMAYLRFVDSVVNMYGTNDAAGWDVETLLDCDVRIANLPFVKGKRLVGCTIPPRTDSSDYFTTLNNQTFNANDELHRLALNQFRRTATFYSAVLDFDSIAADQATGKWKIATDARTVTVSMQGGSAIVTAEANTFKPTDDGKMLVVLTAGLNNADVIGRMIYVSDTTVRLVNKFTREGLTANHYVANITAYACALHYTFDGVHENQQCCQDYMAQLRLTF